MFDSFLLTRSLSQALQATLAIAFCYCWAQRTHREPVLRGIRWSLVAAVPTTLVAAWLFGQTSYQARWEATLATFALVVATWFAIALWRTRSESSPLARRADDRRVAMLCAAAAVVVIVRQTMEIGVVLRAAIVDVRSMPAVAGICAGTSLGLLASWAWIKVGRRLSDDALAMLQVRAWPGNLRQLRNNVERMLILASGATSDPITADMLPPEASVNDQSTSLGAERIIALPLREAREVFEREYLNAQMLRFSGNISRTAAFIGMERSALHRKLKSLGLSGARSMEAEEA
jgi:hypothetical protein